MASHRNARCAMSRRPYPMEAILTHQATSARLINPGLLGLRVPELLSSLMWPLPKLVLKGR